MWARHGSRHRSVPRRPNSLSRWEGRRGLRRDDSQRILERSATAARPALYGVFRETSIAARGVPVILPVCALVVIPVVGLLAGAIRWRRIAQFSAALLRASAERETASREFRQYATVNLVQWLALGGFVVWAVRTGHLGVMWSVFGVLAGLHSPPSPEFRAFPLMA